MKLECLIAIGKNILPKQQVSVWLVEHFDDSDYCSDSDCPREL